jgi:glycosyltransferase involved in cell wall biosynthesis
VVAEALSFGLPVICLDNEGPGEFINADCGFAIPHSDYYSTVSGLEKAIQALYFDKELLLKMSVAARKHYEEKFTWNSRGEKLKNIYNQL